MTTIRVLIVDDQELVRSGFALILAGTEDLQVVGAAADGTEAVRLAGQLHPDVILMDIRMPGIDGIGATAQICQADDRVKVIMLTTFDDEELVIDAMRAGAAGFLLKDVRPRDLTDAVRTVRAGGTLLSPAVTRGLVDRALAQHRTSAPPTAIAELTSRESQVLTLLARGSSNAEIAETLVLSETTVKSHVAAILRKLQVRDRLQAVVAAYDAGLVRPADRG